MDLYLKPEELNELFVAIRNQYNQAPEYEGGTLFTYKNSFLQKGNMEFCLGHEDVALFYHHHPYDRDDFDSVSVRSLYEELVMLKKNWIDEEDILYEVLSPEHGQVINVGKMIEKREQINALLSKSEVQQDINQVPEAPDPSVPEPDFLIEKNIVMTEQEMMHSNEQHREHMGNDFYEALGDQSGTSLLFKESNPGELIDYFKRSVDEGNGYVVYDACLPISAKDLRCFELFVDAQSYCFEKNQDGARYSFTSIDRMQRELEQSADVNLLEGYSSHLEPRMKHADWYYSYSDDSSVWQKGVQETEGIIKNLQALSRLPGGAMKASELWDKYVPQHSVSKPDFFKASDFRQMRETSKNDIKEQSVIKPTHFFKQKTSHHIHKRRPRL